MSARHTVAVGLAVLALAVLALAAPSLADEFVMPEDFEYSEPTFTYTAPNPDGTGLSTAYSASYDADSGGFVTRDGSFFVDVVYPDNRVEDERAKAALNMLLASVRNAHFYAQTVGAKLDDLWAWGEATSETLDALMAKLKEKTSNTCNDACKCIATSVQKAKTYTDQGDEELDTIFRGLYESLSREVGGKAAIVELDTERTDRGAADAEILGIIASLHNGVPGDSLSNLLATVAFTGNYGDLDGKPQASFLIDLTSSGPADGPIDVTFHQGSLGSTNVTDFSFTIPKCKWDDSLLDGIRDRLGSLESSVSDHEGRITALEGKVDNIVSCTCSGNGGGDSGGSGGDCGCSSMNYVTWDELNALDLGSGCDCNLEGIQSQINTLRTELIRLLNYVGYQEHRNGPGR